MKHPVGFPRPRRRDAIVATICWAVVMLLLVTLSIGVDPDLASDVPVNGSMTWWVMVLVLAGQSAALLWARAAPRLVLLGVAGVPLVVTVALAGTGTGVDAAFSLTLVPLMVASYVAFVERPVREVGPAGFVAAGLTFAGYLVTGLHEGTLSLLLVVASSIGQGAVVVGGPAFVALIVATRRDIRLAREHELLALQREQDALVREARAQERTAMARELHDIAAHHLSGIAVMAAAIERQIATDPASATEGVRQVRSQSTAVLRDLRRLVGLLREGDAATLAVETLDGIAELTAQSAASGTTVGLATLRPHGSVDDAPLGAGVGPLAQLTAFRMVQEALANAVQHATGARCLVTIDDRDPVAVAVTVHNDAGSSAPTTARTGGGFGLVGMRERAELTASELRFGPTIDGGWDVSLRLRRDTTAGVDASTEHEERS